MLSSFLLPPSSFILLAEFPRGPGSYFHPGKLAAVALVYLCWVRTCWWVNTDAKDLKLPAPLWNAVMLAGGALGLLLAWAVPLFWVGLPALLALYLGTALIYVGQRNEAVSAERRVLTGRHLRLLANRYLRLGLRLPAE